MKTSGEPGKECKWLGKNPLAWLQRLLYGCTFFTAAGVWSRPCLALYPFGQHLHAYMQAGPSLLQRCCSGVLPGAQFSEASCPRTAGRAASKARSSPQTARRRCCRLSAARFVYHSAAFGCECPCAGRSKNPIGGPYGMLWASHSASNNVTATRCQIARTLHSTATPAPLRAAHRGFCGKKQCNAPPSVGLKHTPICECSDAAAVPPPCSHCPATGFPPHRRRRAA